ncbi:MAG: GAF domain-containing protein [Nitrospirota bacterium]
MKVRLPDRESLLTLLVGAVLLILVLGAAVPKRVAEDWGLGHAHLLLIVLTGATLFVSHRRARQLGSRNSELDTVRRELQSSRRRLEHLLAQSPAVIYSCPVEAFKPTYISANVQAITGHEPGAFLEDPDFWLRNVHPGDTESLLAEVPQLLEVGHGVFVYRFRQKGGGYLWLHDERHVVREAEERPEVVGTWIDVSARMQAREELRQSEERFRSTFEGAAVGMAIVEPSGRLLQVNGALLDMLGYAQEELAGKTLGTIGHPEDAARSAPLFRQLVADQRSHYRMESRCLHKDGSILWTDLSASLVKDPGGRPRFAVFMVMDITQRKVAEAGIIRAMRALSALSRCNNAIIRASDEVSLLEETCRIMVETGGYLFAWVGSVENGPQKQVRPAARAGREDGYLEAVRVSWADEPHGRGPTGTAIRKGEPSFVRDTESDPRFAPWRGEALKRGYRSVLALPLIEGQTTFAALTVYAGESGAFDSEEVVLLTELAGVVAHGVAALRLRTERQRAQATISRQMQRLRSLRTVDMAITASLDIGVTLDILLTEVLLQLEVDAAAVLLQDHTSLLLEYRASRGFSLHDIMGSSLRLGEGLAGRVALARKPVFIADLAQMPEEDAGGPLVLKHGFTAYFALPLLAKGEVQGVLEIFNRSALELEPDWLDFIESLAGQAAIAIDNATLLQNLQRSRDELILAYDSTIEGWSRALDYRDKETEGHSERVTEMTLRVARSLGAAEEDMAHVRWGALLHDIGKLGVPDRILFKPGPLTEEEWKVMKRHPLLAYELLSPIPFLRRAMDIPYCHHEKWDGTGYPRGLRKKEIPLSARIFSVVDVWDALSSDRPYRPAWPREHVLSYLREQSGVHFDPSVVETFLGMDW